MSQPRRTIGDGALLRLLALAHAIVGVGIYRAELRSIVRSRVFASIPYRGPKATVFWFLVPSPLVWIIGGLISHAEQAGDWNAVRAAHRISLGSAAVAIACMPLSGFWGWLAISARGLSYTSRS